MRRILLALLLLPLAQAQAPSLTLVEVAIDPFEGPVEPLQGSITTKIHARISCALIRAPAGATFSYRIIDAPKWATIVLDPASDGIEATDCQNGFATREATLVVTASDQAPAYVPTPIEVELQMENSADVARASVSLEATYFSVLDMQLPRAIFVVPPGSTIEVPMKFTNFGNGPTRVTTTLVDAGKGLTVTIPEPVTLESTQTGGNLISTVVMVGVRTADASGFVNQVDVINLALNSTYAGERASRGDESSASVLITTRSGAVEAAAKVPAAGSAVLIAALSLGTVLMRRRP